MSDINETLSQIMSIDGATCVSLVDSSSGMVLGEQGSGVDMELAAAGNSEVVKAKLRTMESLGLDDSIQDILITLNKQYHIIRPLQEHKDLFLYMVLDQAKSNLALARRKLLIIEDNISI